jgi:Tfp pilus assembly protein PilF
MSIRKSTMRRKGLWLIAALLISGCSEPAETSQVAVPADGIDSIAPQQIQQALQQLAASDARQQRNGLEFVDRFPSLAHTHRPLLEHLAQEGASAAIRTHASQLLQSNPNAP